jgi:hypothetical protein
LDVTVFRMQKKGHCMMASGPQLRAVAFGRTLGALHLTNPETGLH